jgi:hypothetical protein
MIRTTNIRTSIQISAFMCHSFDRCTIRRAIHDATGNLFDLSFIGQGRLERIFFRSGAAGESQPAGDASVR